MAGTDHRTREEALDPGPVFVLVQPQMGENIGAAARAMWNFGLSRMRIVAPRDGWPNPAAVAMASGAGFVLEDAQLFDNTQAAVGDAQIIYATTARPREMTKRVLTPEDAMTEARGHVAAGQRVAVLFGPERAGLANEDTALADALISVPVNSAFGSLNLAQCALLVAYEWRRQTMPTTSLEVERAEAQDVGHLIRRLVEELDEAGFFWPEHKRAAMLGNLENLFRRLALSDQDVRTLHGVIRALATGPRRDR